MDFVNLEFSPAEMRSMADAVVSHCVEHIASAAKRPVCGDVDARELCRSLREAAPEERTELAPLLDDLFEKWIPRSFGTPHPGYLAYIPGGGLYPAALADFIANTTNRYTGVWQAAPALVQLEANALDWLREWMGFPFEARGLFTTGGSMATFNAILCARERHLGAEIRRGVLYTSDQAHHSVVKSAKMAGIMPDRVRAIACDAQYRLPIDALREAIAKDRRDGLMPFAVVSSAGTTNTGAVDPLNAIADLCTEERLWHHIDGAYGAFFYLCDALKPTLDGLSRADSLTLDPHKGMFLPYGTGALLVRDGAALRAAHEATADYLPTMPHPDDFYDPSQHGPDLSRGFPGLRVWLSIKLFGTAGFRSAISEKRALTVDAARRVAALPHIVIDAPPELSLFAFHLSWPGATRDDENAATRALMERTTQRGRVMITGAVAGGRYLGRVCVLSFRTHHEQIDHLIADMRTVIGELGDRYQALMPERELRTRAVLWFWLPLAATWLMMSIEGPYIAAIVARLPDAAYNLAAYGVAFAFAWMSESPIMMFLTASNRLVHDRQSLLALRRFASALNAIVTAGMFIVVVPPVFRFMTDDLMGLPPEVSTRLHVAMILLIPWPGAIGYRRFYQGLLVRRGLTRRVAYGTIIRLAAMSVTGAVLALKSSMHGSSIGAATLSAGVIAEAIASRWMARHVVTALLTGPNAIGEAPLTQRGIARFYFPLALTSMLSMITGPLLTFFMGRGRLPLESLAVLPVVQNLVFMFRSGGVAFQEVGVALSGRHHEHEREVGRAALVLAGASSTALAVLLFTPLADVAFVEVSGLSPELAGYALMPARLLVLLPAMEYWLSFQRSRFILSGHTRAITFATAIEVSVIAVALAVCVGPLDMMGVVAGSVALVVGRLTSNLFLLALTKAA